MIDYMVINVESLLMFLWFLCDFNKNIIFLCDCMPMSANAFLRCCNFAVHLVSEPHGTMALMLHRDYLNESLRLSEQLIEIIP